jgi:hypothetical protein
MFRERVFAIAILCMVSLCACAQKISQAGPEPLKRYESRQPAFTLVKPESWKVTPEAAPDSLRITVSAPEATSVVQVYFGENRQGLNSLKLLAFHAGDLRSHYPDLKLSDVTACKDLSCAAATVSYTRDKILLKGKSYYQTDPRQVVIRSYRAPAPSLEARKNMLLNILANIRLGGGATQPGRAAKPGESFTPAPPIQVALVPRSAPDGSLRISLPPDWKFLGGGGRVIAGAPGGTAGFLFTLFEVMPSNYGVQVGPNVIISPYQPPSALIVTAFGKFGNRNMRVLSATRDMQTTAACPAQSGRACEAEDIVLSWVSPEGNACTGSFKVINGRPNMIGHWFSIVGGVWGPAQDLARYLPMLEQIAASFSINDRYAQSYIQQGLARLREQQQRTQQAMKSLNEARADNQAAWEARQARKDAQEAKWDDYRRGNTYWISEMEGGKVYKTDPWGTQDTSTGTRYEGAPHDYVHFEGQNPRHPSETMREVSSYEVQQLMGKQ